LRLPRREGERVRSDYYNLAFYILLPLGGYFQIQDDYLDFSAEPELLEKIGTDIMDNKCL